MKRIYQTAFGPDEGNCMRACIASLLDIHIDDIPAFELYEPKWSRFYALQAWLQIQGYRLSVLLKEPPCISIAVGPSVCSRGLHAVVWLRGQVLHNPNPDGGLGGDPVSFWTLHKSGPTGNSPLPPSTLSPRDWGNSAAAGQAPNTDPLF